MRSPYGDDIQVVALRRLHRPRPGHHPAGPNGLLETPVAPGDDSTWFPNLYDDLTFRGADGTLYQTPSPMLKYDQLFSTSARSWEAANSQNQDIHRWPGHCLGGAVASILLNEPTPAPGSGMTQDELKALWAELGENHYNHRIGDYANDIPPARPAPASTSATASSPGSTPCSRPTSAASSKALLGNLRAFPPRGTTNEVWNHGIGKYTAKFHAIPGKGDRAVRLEVDARGATPGRASTARTTSPGSSTTSTRWSTGSTARSTRPTSPPPTGSAWAARRCTPR